MPDNFLRIWEPLDEKKKKKADQEGSKVGGVAEVEVKATKNEPSSEVEKSIGGDRIQNQDE